MVVPATPYSLHSGIEDRIPAEAGSSNSGKVCRGFVTSGVMDDFIGVGLRESSISELGIAGTKIHTDLPRFGPLNVR